MNRKNIKTRISISFMGLFVLACVFLVSSTNAFAEESVVDQVNITIPTSCSLSGTGMDTHNTTIHNNESDSAIGESVITAYCNDINGFSIYAIGFTNDEDGNNYLTDSNLDSTSNIPTGTATTGATSSWAMKLAPVTSPTPTYPITIIGSTDDTDKTATTPDYTAFQPVPNKHALVARRKAATDVGANAEGSSFKTTYQAYASPSQLAGTYIGQVKYTLIHPYDAEAPLSPETTASGKICYYANASSAEGTMGCQNVASSVTLLASNFSRTGYGFAGWSDKFDYATNSEAKFYGPQETMTIPDTSIYTGEGKGLSLYAVWVKSAGNLQDSTKVSEVCNRLDTAPTDGTANLSSVSAFTDSRDSNTYAIAKLADGKCWMIENLRLENTGTDNTNGSLAQGYNSSFIGLANPETPWSNNSTAANSLYTTESDIQGKNTISGSNQGYRFPRYNNTNTSARAEYESGQNVTTQNASIYSYGNYYTWPAAIADTTAYTSNNTNVTNTSICPSGWHLLKGGDKSNEANNEFWSLVVTGINNGTNPANYDSNTQPYYTGTPEGTDASNKLRAYPNNFVYSGYVGGGSVSNRGSYGYFWSSTAYSSLNAYYLCLSSSYVSPGAVDSNKYYGRTVRCVAPGV